MKRLSTSIFLICLLSLMSCGSDASQSESHSDADAHSDTHSSGDIIIEPEDAKSFGIETAEAQRQPFAEVVRVSGRIVSPSTDVATLTAATRGIVTLSANITQGSQVKVGECVASISAKNIAGGDPATTARVAVESAKRAVDRLKPLLDLGIATQREYDDALAAYNAALSSYNTTAVSGSVVSPVSGTITQLYVTSGQFVEVGSPIAVVSGNSKLILNAELPEKYRDFYPSIISATFRTASEDSWRSIESLSGKRTDNSLQGVVSTNGYLPVLFTIDNDGTLSSGMFVDVCLSGNFSGDVIALPDKAIIEQQGQHFVYVKTGDHSYEKRRVEVGATDGSLIEIVSGVNEGDNVVVKGAMMVKLAESNGAVPEGHTHNH
ncbi:MAG: efflux RND transporter periplasmic adaptor subunit [Bacteroides sp.]|nr:efflux RND transporter periplasmic adaptor subunit [Bacteroides sp.]